MLLSSSKILYFYPLLTLFVIQYIASTIALFSRLYTYKQTESSASLAAMATKAVHPEAAPTDVDKNLYEHYSRIVCAVTKGKVSENTPLAALYTFTGAEIDNELLRNLTGIADPAVRCGLFLDNKAYPPEKDKSKYGYNLYLTYNKLVSSAHE